MYFQGICSFYLVVNFVVVKLFIINLKNKLYWGIIYLQWIESINTYNLIILYSCVPSWNRNRQDVVHFGFYCIYFTKRFFMPLCRLYLPLPPLLVTLNWLTCLEFYLNRISWYIIFCFWLVSPSRVILRFILLHVSTV